MKFLILVLAACMAESIYAQDAWTRHNFEIGGGGMFPVSGYKAEEYSSGPAGRVGFEFHALKWLGAEVGINEAGLTGSSCESYGCTYSRETFRFLDSGLRAHVLLDRGRIDLSVGIGGGYVWYPYADLFTNEALLQYSGKAAVALDRGGRFRLAFTVRTWRDLGRPTQQWLSTMGSLVVGLDRH